MTRSHVANPIRCAKTLFEYGRDNIHGITFFYASKEDVNAEKEKLSDRFQSCKTVQGTRSHHQFAPVGNLLEVKRFSTCDKSTIRDLFHK